jgi:hypothetical protein
MPLVQRDLRCWTDSLIDQKHGAQVFDAQAIPTDATLLEVATYKVFLTERRKLIAACLNEFLLPGNLASTKSSQIAIGNA